MFFERTSFLKSLSTRLKTIAFQNDLAVVLVNNVISAFSEDYKKANKVKNSYFHFELIKNLKKKGSSSLGNDVVSASQ